MNIVVSTAPFIGFKTLNENILVTRNLTQKIKYKVIIFYWKMVIPIYSVQGTEGVLSLL